MELSAAGCDALGNVSAQDIESLFQNTFLEPFCHSQSDRKSDGHPGDRGAAHERGILMIVDGAQTAGVFPVDLFKDHVDVFCFTGHKSLLGPQGTGGMAVRRDFSYPL